LDVSTGTERYYNIQQWAKSPKKKSEGVHFCLALKIQCHVVKNTLLQQLFHRFCPLGTSTEINLIRASIINCLKVISLNPEVTAGHQSFLNNYYKNGLFLWLVIYVLHPPTS